MSKVVISFDTETQEQISVNIDGKDIANVQNISIYQYDDCYNKKKCINFSCDVYTVDENKLGVNTRYYNTLASNLNLDNVDKTTIPGLYGVKSLTDDISNYLLQK